MSKEREIDKIDTLLTAEEIAERVEKIGKQISLDYRGKLDGQPLILICVLKGSFIFTADLMRAIDEDIPVIVQFIAVSSYEGKTTKSSGAVRLAYDLRENIEGRDCIIVEDIVDTGLTVKYLLDLFGARKPRSLRVCTLLHKPSREKVKVPLQYVGYTIENKFVVGCGLDYDQLLRGRGDIGELVFKDEGEEGSPEGG